MYINTVPQQNEQEVNKITIMQQHLAELEQNCTDKEALASIRAEAAYTKQLFDTLLTPAEINARRARLAHFKLILKGVTADNRETHADKWQAEIKAFEYKLAVLFDEPVTRGIIERRGVAA